jgi:hypothetical protein
VCDPELVEMASEHRRDSRVAPEFSGHTLHHFQVSLQDIPPGLANNSSGTGIECSIYFLMDPAQIAEVLMQNRTDFQSGLFRFDFSSTCSVLNSHLVNKNQDGIAKFDINIDHGGSDGIIGWRSVADILDGSLVKNDFSFEALLNYQLDSINYSFIVTVTFRVCFCTWDEKSIVLPANKVLASQYLRQ